MNAIRYMKVSFNLTFEPHRFKFVSIQIFSYTCKFEPQVRTNTVEEAQQYMVMEYVRIRLLEELMQRRFE